MIKIGIFFGGQSREREISFAGGRTVYDNLDKSIFEAIPIFVDGLGNFIELEWKYIYKGTIRDFFPPAKFYPENEKHFQLYIDNLEEAYLEQNLDAIIEEVGKKVYPHQFSKLFDFAFLALHGPFGEDGNIQGILEWNGIPYSGCGILPSSIGINKIVQKKIMQNAGLKTPEFALLERNEWSHFNNDSKKSLFDKLVHQIGLPFVVKAPNQGSSLGVSIIKEHDFDAFNKAVNKSFFITELEKDYWQKLSETEKINLIAETTDLRTGIGLPVVVRAITSKASGGTEIASPTKLIAFLDEHFQHGYQTIMLEYIHGEQSIIVEKFVKGIEFSCIVIQDENGKPLALPPTQIVKGTELFDYRSKYLPGISRKITPIDLPLPFIIRIIEECERLFEVLQCNVYARIDGFFAEDGLIYLNDPNTTSGMLPSSFFFHQAAEIGLNPSQFLTYIIHISLKERLKLGKNIHPTQKLIHKLEQKIHEKHQQLNQKIKVGVIMGGYSSERHISVESGRNIYEKLASSIKYQPIPYFLTLPKGVFEGDGKNFELYKLPINIMLKDNADDIKDKVHNIKEKHEIITQIQEKAKKITELYTQSATLEVEKTSISQIANEVKEVFIALHGRPGEDGALQIQLKQFGLPFNGSDENSSSITINKYETNEILLKNGFLVAKHLLIDKSGWNDKTIIEKIETQFGYPFIVKPHDDGCSSAVKKIKNRAELMAYAEMIFRNEPEFIESSVQILKLKYHEEFPQKQYFLIEELIEKGDALHFLEVTGGMLTKYDAKGSLVYEIFEPSETLASGEVLSLEEKFLAGEGQNITPARYSKSESEQKKVSEYVKNTLFNVAQTLNIQGYCRIDAFVKIYESEIKVYIIEINSLPGMTPATCIFHQCAINGYKPFEFIDKILEFGLQRKEKAV